MLYFLNCCLIYRAPETADAIEDSDDEVDYTKMDMVCVK